MKQEVNPKETSRAQAFELWMQSPVPMLTFTKTFDVTHLRRVCKRRNLKFNMLLCWCIGHVASRIEECYLLPENGKLYRYDRMAINVIVDNAKGGISNCDIPYSDDLAAFVRDYETLTRKTAETCCNILDEEAIIVGTSAITDTELDAIVNQYSGRFNNPFLVWARYHKGWFRTTLPISLQFHHAQMDGGHAARMLEELQQTINRL